MAGIPGRSRRRHQLAAVHADQEQAWQTSWVLMTVVAAVGTAAASWALVGALCMLGWIAIPEVSLRTVFAVATRGWLLAHGVPVSVPSMTVSVVPLGATAIIVLLALGACQLAARHSRPPASGDLAFRWLRSGLLFSLVYVLILVLMRSAVIIDGVENRTMVPAILLMVLLGLGGFVRPLGLRPARPHALVAPALRAVTAAWLWMVMVGAAVVVMALAVGMQRVVAIHQSLDPGILGGLMLLLGQLAWLPNIVLWGAAWASGAGVQIGLDTVISPVMTQVGILPAIPVLGVIPDTIAMPTGQVAWVACGVVAGGLAAWVLLRDVDLGPRVDLAALAGGAIGVIAGLVFTATQVLACGDLGSVRLVWIGARLLPLLVMAPTAMGIGGLVIGTVIGWRRARRPLDDALIPTSVVVDRRRVSERAPEQNEAGDDE